MNLIRGLQVATNSEIKEQLSATHRNCDCYSKLSFNLLKLLQFEATLRRVKFPTRQFHLKHELIDNSAQQLVVVERISRGKTSKQCDVSHVQRLTWKLQALVRQQFIQRN